MTALNRHAAIWGLGLLLAAPAAAQLTAARSGESGILDVPDAEVAGLGNGVFAGELRLDSVAGARTEFGPLPLYTVAGLASRLDAGFTMRQWGQPGDPRPTRILFGAAAKVRIRHRSGTCPALRSASSSIASTSIPRMASALHLDDAHRHRSRDRLPRRRFRRRRGLHGRRGRGGNPPVPHRAAGRSPRGAARPQRRRGAALAGDPDRRLVGGHQLLPEGRWSPRLAGLLLRQPGEAGRREAAGWRPKGRAGGGGGQRSRPGARRAPRVPSPHPDGRRRLGRRAPSPTARRPRRPHRATPGRAQGGPAGRCRWAERRRRLREPVARPGRRRRRTRAPPEGDRGLPPPA